MIRRSARRAIALLALLALLAAPVMAGEDKDAIGVELNRLEDHDDSCRAYLVFRNPGAQSYVGFKLDLVVFDRAGIVAQRLAVEAAPLRPAKTEVKVFDIPQTRCATIGSILVNDVLACRDPEGEIAGCVERLTASSKLEVSLIK